jgi:hypothetical protein
MVVKSQIKDVLVATGTDADEAERLLTPDNDQLLYRVDSLQARSAAWVPTSGY